jgi:hypothetical protein
MITKLRSHAIAEALSSLRPLSHYTVGSDESINWIDTVQTQPTQAEIETEIIRLQAEYTNKEYQRNRAAEYPTIGDQLDAIWKGGTAATEMLALVQAVKNKYPKGTE